jgi:subtilisin family serine protease
MGNRCVARSARTAAVVTLLLALAACAAAARIRAVPAAGVAAVAIADSGAAGAAGADLNAGAERMILVTIANDTALTPTEPGSTPHGYDSIGAYAVSDQAAGVGAALGRDYGLRQVRAWPIAPLGVQCMVFVLPPQADRAALVLRLAADRRVRLAQPLQVFNALGGPAAAGVPPGSAQPALVIPATFSGGSTAVAGYNDPYVGLQQGFAAIEAGAAQQWSRGEGVRIAIIDTGVEVSHPDLVGRVAAARNFVDSDMSSFETDRHGTGVAGIIGADANNNLGIVGVAPSAHLQIYKACQPLQPHSLEAQCNSFTLALALDAAISAHAQIVNLSLGGPADPLLAQLVSVGQHRGMIFVGAVPEDGRLDGFPLGVAGVIAVDQIGRTAGSAAVLHAPGSDILSLAPDGRYDFATGSSFAAAHVTGTIALLRARHPGLDAGTLLAVLERTASRDEHGDRINACAALAALEPHNDCSHATKAVATATVLH